MAEERVKCWHCGRTIEAVEGGGWEHWGIRTVYCPGGEPYGEVATPTAEKAAAVIVDRKTLWALAESDELDALGGDRG